MATTYISAYFHVVFSTRHRESFILSSFRDRLWAYLGGIARENNMRALAVGGTINHCHLLLSLPGSIPISKAVQLVKGGSTTWLHGEVPRNRWFKWQEGYGAFSVSQSLLPEVIQYIENQEEHHRHRTFEEEYRTLLIRHGIEFDERYLLG